MDTADKEFTNKIEEFKLPPSQFNHLSHLRLAYTYLLNYGIDKALLKVKSTIINYVNHYNARNKYNETLTVAATKTVYHFMNKSQSTNFNDFILEFPRLQYKFTALIEAHYSIDIFNDPRAKEMFIEPDRLVYD